MNRNNLQKFLCMVLVAFGNSWGWGQALSLDPHYQGVHFIEAESASLNGIGGVFEDSTASGGRALSFKTNSASGQEKCSFSFQLAQKGLYQIYGRFIAEDSKEDSVFVQLDGEDLGIWDINHCDTWQWDGLRLRNPGVHLRGMTPVELGEGKHHLVLITREPEVKLDAVIVTRKDSGFTPPSLVIIRPPLPVGEEIQLGDAPLVFIPETNLPGLNLSNAFEEQNARNHGAIADGKSHPLRERFKSQTEIDLRYGVGRYRPDDEIDFVAVTEAIRYARAAAYQGKNQSEEVSPTIRWKKEFDYGSAPVYLPNGLYVINRTIKITDLRGFTFSGAGKGWQTTLFFNQPGPLFWIQYASSVQFRNFSITTGGPYRQGNKSRGFYVVDSHQGDRAQASRLSAFRICYESVTVQGFEQAVDVAGTEMTDTQQFYSCHFIKNLVGLHLRNAQAMNFEFYGCDWLGLERPENTGRATAFLVEAGGHVNLFGGAMIAMGTVLRLLPNPKYKAGAGGGPTINLNNGKYNLIGVRFEWDKDEPLFFEANDDKVMTAQINIENCVVWKRDSAKTLAVSAPLGILGPGMNVTIRNLNIPNQKDAFIYGDTRSFELKRRGVLIIDNIVGDPLKYGEVGDLSRVFKEGRWIANSEFLDTNEGHWKNRVERRGE